MNQPIQEKCEHVYHDHFQICFKCGKDMSAKLEDMTLKISQPTPPQNTSREEIPEWEQRFDEELGNYTNEYGYVHKIPNHKEIKDFILAEIEAAEKRTKEDFVQALKGTTSEEIYSAGRASGLESAKKLVEEMRPAMHPKCRKTQEYCDACSPWLDQEDWVDELLGSLQNSSPKDHE